MSKVALLFSPTFIRNDRTDPQSRWVYSLTGKDIEDIVKSYSAVDMTYQNKDIEPVGSSIIVRRYDELQ